MTTHQIPRYLHFRTTIIRPDWPFLEFDTFSRQGNQLMKLLIGRFQKAGFGVDEKVGENDPDWYFEVVTTKSARVGVTLFYYGSTDNEIRWGIHLEQPRGYPLLDDELQQTINPLIFEVISNYRLTTTTQWFRKEKEWLKPGGLSAFDL